MSKIDQEVTEETEENDSSSSTTVGTVILGGVAAGAVALVSAIGIVPLR
ncbi:hypothetical protein [Wolbachia endosymbiont of Ctenocephalides felis wCfeJ]|nr:hypothetical protein [Wolbachia endosymbiont of Ctenocephalides felis wCfeJ]WCR57997.1 MAG: hypothetical protein PG980_000469 [Wolbachia endosymbiont of Ctenocephalides felis wCfeJ]